MIHILSLASADVRSPAHEGLFTLGETVLIIIGILALLVAVIGLYPLFREMWRKPKAPFPYFHTYDPDEVARLLFPGKVLEGYVIRQELRSLLGPTLLPGKSRVLIFGLPGVGKTREALELVRRLGKRAVYLSSGTPDIPTALEAGHPRQKVVLFLDNLRVGTPRTGPEEERGADEPVSLQIERVLNFFARQTELVNVVITMTTEEFEKLRDESASARVLGQFTLVHLKELNPRERETCLGDLATRLGLTLDLEAGRRLADSDDSLNGPYDWLEGLSRRSGRVVTRADVDDFVQHRRALWRQVYADLSPEERQVFDSLSLLYATSIPLFEKVTIELALRGSPRWLRLPKRCRLRSALRRLARRYLAIERGHVYCPDYRLRANEPDEAVISRALTDLMRIARETTRRRKIPAHAVGLLNSLSKSLAERNLGLESIRANDLLLGLPREALRGNPASVRSEAYFHQGLGYYRLGRGSWREAERCYRAAIQEDGSNRFAKHALATLYRRLNATDQSLRLLNEIVAADPSDLIASKTRLEILIAGRRTVEGRDTYRALRRLLRGVSADSKTVLSAELACVRYSAAMAEDLREEGPAPRAERAASKTIVRYERLIARIPAGQSELEAVVRNSYGCFLYDVLSRPDAGLVQLEKAQRAWPGHEHTLHKLVTVYLDEAEVRSDEKDALLAKARELLRRLLEARPNHYPSRLTLARLEGESTEWLRIEEGLFWPRVTQIYAKYQAALEPEVSGGASFHNSIAHHSAGCFLWHVEASAHKRRLTVGKPESIPSADRELRESISAWETSEQRLPRAAQHQLILGLHTLGAYLLTVAAGSPEKVQEGLSCLTRAVTLNKRTGSAFQFNSSNSFAESFVGKLCLSMGDTAAARKLLESAVARFDKNCRAWWFLGRVNEVDRRNDEALRCFEKSATDQASPALFGQLRSIMRKIKGPATTMDDTLRYSKKAYELDPQGDLNPKNVSDYGFDVYQKARAARDLTQLREAEQILLKAYERYMSVGLRGDSNFPLWYAAEANDAILGYTDEVSLKRYVEAARLSGRREEYSRLREKVSRYSTRIWQAGGVIRKDLVDDIESCAKLQLDYEDAVLMAGIVLQRNRRDQDALPYLEKARPVKDTYGLRALMECYISLGEKGKAETVFGELSPLLSGAERQKVERRVASLRLGGA